MSRRSLIQDRILEVLSDGRAHSRDELLKCFNDTEATRKNLWSHVFKLRKKLNPVGEHIVCELQGRKILYRHVRLLPSATDGIR